MENKQDKGFTLVELLIVIVILGILATVTVFAVRGITDQGQTSACAADKKTLEVAVEAYYAQNGNVLGAAASETNLIAAGLLTSYSPSHNVASGVVTAGNQVVVGSVLAAPPLLAVPAATASITKCT